LHKILKLSVSLLPELRCLHKLFSCNVTPHGVVLKEVEAYETVFSWQKKKELVLTYFAPIWAWNTGIFSDADIFVPAKDFRDVQICSTQILTYHFS